MFDIPERYKVDLNIKIKDFVPKEINLNDKRRIKDGIRSIKMMYQIAGEEIPSLINDDYRCEVIQYYEIELNSIKEANFLASIYQPLIKPLCVIRFYDSKDEVYAFAEKRLNCNNENEIVIDDMYLSQKYPYGLPGEGIGQFNGFLSYGAIKNKTEKLSFYRECMYKLFIQEHKSSFSEAEALLCGEFWYSSVHSRKVYLIYNKLTDLKNKAAEAQSASERVDVNKEIRKLIKELRGALEQNAN